MRAPITLLGLSPVSWGDFPGDLIRPSVTLCPRAWEFSQSSLTMARLWGEPEGLPSRLFLRGSGRTFAPLLSCLECWLGGSAIGALLCHNGSSWEAGGVGCDPVSQVLGCLSFLGRRDVVAPSWCIHGTWPSQSPLCQLECTTLAGFVVRSVGQADIKDLIV